MGNRTSMTVTDSGGTKVHVYTYDSIYQIKEVDYPVGFEYLATDTAFHYDAAGNRSSVIGGSGVAVNQGKRRINPRSATRPQDHEPAGRLFICVLPGTLSPHPWDLPLCARGRIEEQATSYSYHVAPVPGPERRSGCFPAAPPAFAGAGSILRAGVASVSRVRVGRKGYPGGRGWKTSKAVWKPRHLRGRWLIWRTEARSCASVTWVRSVPLGRY